MESPIEHRENPNPTFTQNLEKVLNKTKTKIPNPIIKELVKIWSVYRPAQTLEHLTEKIERFNEGTWYPNKIIRLSRECRKLVGSVARSKTARTPATRIGYW